MLPISVCRGFGKSAEMLGADIFEYTPVHTFKKRMAVFDFKQQKAISKPNML